MFEFIFLMICFWEKDYSSIEISLQGEILVVWSKSLLSSIKFSLFTWKLILSLLLLSISMFEYFVFDLKSSLIIILFFLLVFESLFIPGYFGIYDLLLLCWLEMFLSENRAPLVWLSTLKLAVSISVWGRVCFLLEIELISV